MTNPMRLVATSVLLSLLAACSPKAKTEETAAATTAPTETPAAPAPEAAAATPETTPAPGTAGTFDINSVPVSAANLGGFPYLGRLKGYRINTTSDSVAFEFDRIYVFDGQNLVAVEGRVLLREYIPVDEQRKTSELMMQRNYENLIKSLGGVRVSTGELPSAPVEKMIRTEFNKHNGDIDPGNPVDTYVIRQKDKEVWVQVSPSTYSYQLNVIEKAAMPQQVSTIKADELKKN
ncbi:MAG: hypothetical protein H7Z21_13525 [Hymenobacter sp.]|nr:hypothetical protein [Hymenobacter sp.]